MFKTIGDFFNDVGNWISGLFGGKDSTPTPPKATIEVGPLEQINIDPEDLKSYFAPQPIDAEELKEEETKIDENEDENEGDNEGDNEEPTEEPGEEEIKPKEDETPDMTSTPVNDASEDGIHQAYFAKKVLKKVKTSTVAENYSYQFNGSINVGNDRNAIAANIVKNSEKDDSLGDRHISVIDVLSAMPDGKYEAKSSISIPAKKIEKEVSYEKIESAALEDDIYVFVKTANLDGKEITITIQEKEKLLIGAGAPLPVLKREDTINKVEKTEDLEEITELKATVNESMVAIPIRLRPKTPEDFKEWQDKLAGGKEDGTHDYVVQSSKGFKVETEAEKSSIAKNIQAASNSKLSPDHKVKIEDILKKLSVGQSFTSQEKITLPKYLSKKNTELLWLKASAQGEEKFHEKEFLNESETSYFQIGGCPRCTIDITLKNIEDSYGIMAAAVNLRTEIIEYLNKYIAEKRSSATPIHLDTCLRKAHFFSQVGTETGGIDPNWFVEGEMNHSVKSAKSAFGQRAKNLEASGLLKAYCSDRPQKRLYNYLYAKENGFGNGNGNEASGDGYRFRGRGLKQLTGRGNYKEAASFLKEFFPEEYIDIEQSPEKVAEPKYAVLTALAYWEKHEIWKVADTVISASSSDEDFKKVRRKVVGQSGFHWKQAKEHFQKTSIAFKINECKPSDSEWHNPVDNPIATIFTQSQTDGVYNHSGKHWGLFGNTRAGSAHTGLDLFAKTGDNIYACVDGTVYNRRWHGGYGNTITIKVKDKVAFLAQKKTYALKYSGDGEILQGSSFTENGDIFLFYAHLHTVNSFTYGQDVNCGDVLGTTGRSGVTAGTCAPHLHFEIFSKYVMGTGSIVHRLNPGYYVDYKVFNDLTDSEKKVQQDEAKRGKLKQVDGANKLQYADMPR